MIMGKRCLEVEQIINSTMNCTDCPDWNWHKTKEIPHITFNLEQGKTLWLKVTDILDEIGKNCTLNLMLY